MQRFHKASLLAGTIMAGAVFATPAYAQTETVSGSAEETTETTSILVTGSRIQRSDLNSTSPVTVVSSEEFRLTGAVNVEQVLNTLPQVLPGVTGFSNNPGNGAVTLNMRNLGATRTLVLVNGRRWMFYDTNQIVDLNTIPQFLLGGVELSTGGGSAVYGSDAIAGVVNFNLRDIEGLEVGGSYSLTGRGDAARYQFNAAIGSAFDDGRGAVTMFANYTRRDPVFQDARVFSERAAGDGCIVPGSTGRGDIGTPFPSGIAVGTCIARGGELGFVPQGSATTPTGTFNAGPTGAQSTYIFNPTGGGSRLFQDPGDLFNFAPDNYLQLPQERYLIGAYGHYEFTDGIEAYSELSFVRNDVATELAPTPAGVSAPLFVNSPFFNDQTRALLNQNPADATRGALYRNTQVNFRFQDIGSRNSDFNREAFRVLGGVRGGITDNINFDAYYSYSRTTNTNIQQGNIARSRFINALTTEFVPGSTTQLRCADAAARAAGCVPLNIFGTGLADPAALRYLAIQATNITTSDMKNAVASVSGTLFNLGTGADDIGFAFGGEYRAVSSEFIPDTFLSSGDVLGFNAGLPTSGGYNVKEVFGEVRVPVIEDGFVNALEFTGAFRYSDYSLQRVGGTWTYNVGGEFSPVEGIRFRGMYSRAVRAPNVQDLFGGASTGFPGATDPCSDRGPVAERTAALRAFCIQSGVPDAAVFTRAVQPNAQIQADFGGNPDVGEETSDTYTAGVVIQPGFIPRLNIAIDYFNIKVEDTINTRLGGLGSALSLCFNTVRNLQDPACSAFVGKRNTGTGALGLNSGGLNPSLVQDNVGRLATAGIDLQIDYSLPLFNGDLSVMFLATWLDEFRNTPVALLPLRENIVEGTYGLPDYRHNMRVTYEQGPLTASVRWRYEGATEDFRVQNTFSGNDRIPNNALPLRSIPAWNYFDLALGLDVDERMTINAGVNNLLDKAPPVLGAQAEQGNTLPSFFDVLGRDFFVGVNFRF
ncbi:outer membrane receptor protein involved in Fe transport [Erythromicrobium ramosum]|uniref:Outer membrane receptor protein involved in Fe transport n=1 Tax=Erythrobacter ramosus TaxID=35811 RepID=A0A6I4UPS7_9SPHN|nr:TonB-dependent receptor [Erythrobacter ramosus]MBB3776755.1 outer membrane receptor protein involved in Fe transport [Erythrobacter ramosus]MXP39609.1 TonB-dependent receptor [Erythrobacter ramosus]